jgi:septal ring factor EnvC (AmiA/AmiB activator)
MGFGRSASNDLARVGLTLARPPRRGRWIVLAALLVVGAFAGGAALGELLREQLLPVATRAVVAAPTAAASGELQQLRQQLEQATMELRVAQARGQELERQIDALNQKLTESADQLTFFRKAREGRRH